MGTLFCCALPALFVVLGAGATFAALTDAFPALLIVGEHKETVFGLGAIFIGLAWFGYRQGQPVECSIEVQEESACETTQNWTRPLLMVSTCLYLIGVGTAYVLPLF